MRKKPIAAILASMVLVVILTSVIFYVSKPDMPNESTEAGSIPAAPSKERPSAIVSDVIEDTPAAKSVIAVEEKQTSLPITDVKQHGDSHDTPEESATHAHDMEETATETGATAVMIPDFTDSIQQVDSTASEITVSGDATQIVFSFDDSKQDYYDKTLLNISGPDGFSESSEFGSGEPVSYTGGLDDGIYKWEAVTVPRIPESVKTELMTLRESGNMTEASQRMKEYRDQGLFPSEQEVAENRISGGFRIQDGVLVEQVEEE